MPPAATQNLNAKLSARHRAGRVEGGSGLRAKSPSMHTPKPRVRIVGAGSGYRGGYRVER